MHAALPRTIYTVLKVHEKGLDVLPVLKPG
jgi:hypothetical protein